MRDLLGGAWRVVGTAAKRSLPAALATMALLALGLGLLAGYRFLRTSPRFAIKAFEVVGAAHMSRDEVIAIAGVRLGTNIFALDADAMEQRLERLPWVANANVRRRLPTTLALEITERVAVAALSSDGLYLVDAAGYAFKRADTATGELRDLPIISGLPREAFGEDGAAASAMVRATSELAKAWNAAATASALPEAILGEVRVEPDDTLTLYTRDAGIALHVGALTAARVPVTLAKVATSLGGLSPTERAALRAMYLDNQTRTNYVTVAFAK